MTFLQTETKEPWKDLCERAVAEQNPERFLATIRELLQVLERDEERRRTSARVGMPAGEEVPALRAG